MLLQLYAMTRQPTKSTQYPTRDTSPLDNNGYDPTRSGIERPNSISRSHIVPSRANQHLAPSNNQNNQNNHGNSPVPDGSYGSGPGSSYHE